MCDVFPYLNALGSVGGLPLRLATRTGDAATDRVPKAVDAESAVTAVDARNIPGLGFRPVVATRLVVTIVGRTVG